MALLACQSHRLKRIARSSLAVEGMTICEAIETAEHLRAVLAEVLVPGFVPCEWETAADHIEVGDLHRCEKRV